MSDTPQFRHVGEQLLHSGAVVDLVQIQVEGPGAVRMTRDVVRHPGAVAVVAIDDEDRVVLVRQYRAALDDEVDELPAGKLDADGETPATTARRELREETGLVAERWSTLVSYFTAPGFTDEVLHLFLAEGLRQEEAEADGPEEEAMVVHRVPLGDCLARVRSGGIRDAKTIIGVLLASSLRSGLS